MIETIEIKNIALIEHICISFHNGMHVLTGETGAGKSIIVDAVNLILGSRADKDLIRSGCDSASVEAVFDVPGNQKIAEIFGREQIDYDGRTVIIYREISAGGRNICRICGIIVPLTVLKELSAYLMDIHGQHEHRFLMDPERHRQFLDAMGDEEHRKLLEATAESCEEFLLNHREYARLVKENEKKQFRIEQLEQSLKELSAADLKTGEDESLDKRCRELRSAEKTVSVMKEAYDQLSVGITDGSSLEKVKRAMNLLLSAGTEDPAMKAIAGWCESIYYELEEISYELYRIIEKTENSTEELEKAESRLDLLKRILRKYGGSLYDVMEEQRKMQAEYEKLCGLDDRIHEMSKQHKSLLQAYRRNAQELSESRKTLAKDFENRMTQELQELGLGNTVFCVSFAEKNDKRPQMPRISGDDDIEFMISSNPGEPMKPLAKIASGGELSRFMLAIKALEAGKSDIDSMVFDEIDTGISGHMAQVVAEKMISISRERQVICVTHLPQIAAGADHQYEVKKAVREGRTYTGVEELDRAGRVDEIARLVSGAGGITEDTEQYAEKMIIRCEKLKKEKLHLAKYESV